MHSRFVSRLCRLLFSLCAAHASFAVAAPGDRDASFGNGGGVVYAVPGVPKAWAYRIFEQADGKLVAVGFAQPGAITATQDMLALRFNADGSLDTSFGASFGTPGRVQIDFAGFGDYALGGLQQADGNLLIVGSASNGTSQQVAAIRLFSDGQLDPTFGNGGRVVIPFSGGFATDAFIDSSDGGIVLAGTLLSDVALVRLRGNGTIDTNFGIAGIARVDAGGSESVTRILRQGDGRYVAVGRVFTSGPVIGVPNYNLLATRINTNGTLDTTFGVNGRVSTPCISVCNWTGVTQQSNDGKLLIAGTVNLASEGNPALFQEESMVVRLNVDGTPDLDFGANGYLKGLFVPTAPSFFTSGDEAVETSVDPITGSITILGALVSRIYNAPGTSGVLAYAGTATARVLSNGELDPSFGDGGTSIVSFGTQPAPVPYNVTIPRTLLRAADGRLLVLGLTGEYVNALPQAQVVSLARLLDTGGDPGVFGPVYPGPMTESIGNAVVRVFRHSGSTGPVSVSYTTVSGSAVAESDFVATSGTLYWADGDDSIKLISIPILADDTIESGDETFSIVFSAPTGGADLLGSTVNLTIVRDDMPPATSITLSQSPVNVLESVTSVTLTVTRTGSNAASVVYYTIPGTATVGSDFTRTSGILAWSTGDSAAKTITIPVISDSIYESAEAFNLVFVTQGGGAVYGGQTATVIVNDDDPAPQVGFIVANKTVNESAGLVTFDVTRVGATSQSTSVNYATANGTAMAGSDYQAVAGTLTWGPNDASTKTIAVTLLTDSLHEGGSDETFAINLSDATAAVLGASTATVAIVDDDAAPQLSFAVAKVKVNERDASITLLVTRTGASGLIHSVDFATRDGSARAGRDYVAVAGTLTWLATDPDTKTITVPIIRKPRREDNENFKVDISNATSGASIGLAECKVVITEKPRN